jgi:osmotically-inducible protein OsmY
MGNKMKTNAELQNDVQDAIKWEPLLNAAEIGVTVKDGVVTLTGSVDNYSKKSQAEDAAKNVAGVKAVVEKIEINYSSWGTTSDGDIAKEIISALKWNSEVPNDKVKVKVENGWVTLDGELPWNFQKDATNNAVSNLNGVKGVSNNIKIKSEVDDAIEQNDIKSALERYWLIDDDDINVEVSGTKVTLTGSVGSWFQKDEAGRIAWNAPGVEMVVNNLVVEYHYELMD